MFTEREIRLFFFPINNMYFVFYTHNLTLYLIVCPRVKVICS